VRSVARFGVFGMKRRASNTIGKGSEKSDVLGMKENPYHD